MKIKKFNIIQLFAEPQTNVTTDSGLSATIKEYYDTQLLENARAELYHTQFGQKQSLPKGKGKTVEWRKWDTFAVDTEPLTEGVTPDGQKMNMTHVTATVEQYGNYVTISDVLELTSFDDTIIGATEELGAQGGETEDILTREVLIAGTNVMYAPNGTTAVTSRANIASACILTPSVVNRAVTVLKKYKAPKINGKYVAIIHPSVAMDLRESDGWIEAHKYAATTELFNGEIGELHGCRFIETTNAKVWKEAGAEKASVYGCLFLGKDAYGVVDPDGAGMKMIIKPLGSAGTADPLDQRSTVGYKFSTAAVILYPERLLRVECGSSFGADDVDVTDGISAD